MPFIKKILDKTSDWILANTNHMYKDALNHWNSNIFEGHFAYSTNWSAMDTEESFLRNKPPGYTATSITYCINNFGFRGHSEEDLNSNSTENTIACFGCSQTFGVGLKYEDTWPYKLKELTNNKIKIKNYGRSGASSDKISRFVYNYLLDHKPLAVCCLLPDIFRREIVHDYENLRLFDYQFIHNTFSNASWPGSGYKEDIWNAGKRLANEPNSYYNFIKNILFIESVCKANNIKCYTMAWDPNFLKTYQSNTLAFESFVGTFNDSKYEYLTNCNGEKARDCFHLGPAYQQLYAELFYNRITQDNIL